MQFRGLDLNLLVVFRALLVHRNLTRVAEELGLTQPAISHALKRLRLHYNDDLFTRNGNRMDPTPRALELAAPIHEALDRIYGTFEANFDPKSVQRTVRVGFVDYESVFFLPILVQKFSDQAPGIEVAPDNLRSEVAVELLLNGRLDLVIGDLLEERSDIQRDPLFREPFVALTGASNPVAGQTLSAEAFSGQRHIQLPIYRRLERQLRDMGAIAGYAVSTKNVMSVPSMLSRSELIAVVPKTFADVFRQLHEVSEVHTDFALPDVIVDAAYTRRQSSDPANRWINNCIAAIGVEIREKLAAKAAADWTERARQAP
jgi:DNA-binding transcriptional LysR family regulator